ncbi:YtxH domain-containing protein [Ancylothrix sp. C2]|uniref:YtxH domain-containing protein n=1 Tax=Ancylothrix sp. D3o TaxID=2953691 RepID=UPI0021BB13F3|nr:YtxH domain-containing protein [Ancylothrix sp. D3o]MCT7951021.1 YtxH domain-containing protein [Ancylothrix sp. D3o]
MSKNNTGTFIGGVLLGTALGTVAGLLFAPRSGRETRKLLKKSADALPELAEDLSTSVQLQADRLSETAKTQWEQTLNRLREAVAAGIEASNLERDTKIQTQNPGSSISPPNSELKTPPHLVKNSLTDPSEI